MINKRHSQTGSTALIITIILTLVIAGGVGFVWWQNANKKDAQTSSSTTNPNTDTPKEDFAEKIDEGKYLKLESWNVKFEIPDSLASSKIKYYIKKSSEGASYYVLTTEAIEQLGGTCAKSQEEQPGLGDVVTLSRLDSKTNEYPGSVDNAEALNETPLNNYYYISGTTIVGCANVDSEGKMLGNEQAEVEMHDRKALREMLETISATNG
jgi:cytoskeletal protein RodZ